MEKELLIYKNTLENMKDGVITIDLQGKITTVNPSAETILEMEGSYLLNKSFAEIFINYEENDGFNQIILDAVYDSSIVHNGVVMFNTGKMIKTLSLTTTYLKSSEMTVGIIAVFSDITELTEIKDALKAMEKIKALNEQLEVRNRFIRSTFGRYLSDDIVNRLIEAPDGLEIGGKRQKLTIVMSDLRGFTTLSESLPPERVLSAVNNFLSVMTDIIFKYGGTIDEFIGDSIFVLFGAPIWMDDHAEKAVKCAVEMQYKMDRVNEWNREKDFPQMKMGIGIHTGDVIVGNIGSEKRSKYGVVGRDVNLTSRIESCTTGGQILISQETKESVADIVTVRNEMEVKLKGIDKLVKIYDVSGIKGGYDLCLKEKDGELCTPDKQIAVRFSMVKDKHIEEKKYDAHITQISSEEAIIIMPHPVKNLSNIKLMFTDTAGKVIKDNVYAKVIDGRDVSRTRIHFTTDFNAEEIILKLDS